MDTGKGEPIKRTLLNSRETLHREILLQAGLNFLPQYRSMPGRDRNVDKQNSSTSQTMVTILLYPGPRRIRAPLAR